MFYVPKLGLREHLRGNEIIDAWSKIVGDFIAAHSACGKASLRRVIELVISERDQYDVDQSKMFHQ